ncbi:MAG: hypothetical protein IJZ17_02145, partial [Muribaculaceae bacterium]|nr:hypothetical protein [Muribaculaceae bacterium]
MKGINNFFKTCPLLRLTCFIIACAAWQSVSAVDYDFGEMQLDVDYQLKNYKSHAGTFVVPEDGILVMTSDNGGWMEAYNEESYETELSYLHSYIDNGQTRSYNVTAGQKVYFYNSFVMTESKIRLSMGQTLSVASIAPEEGSRLVATGSQRCQVSFNMAVTVETVKLVVGDAVVALTPNFIGGSIVVEIQSTMIDLMADGMMKEGDTFKIVFSGIAPAADASALYNGDGKLEVSYICGGNPVRLINETNTDMTFLSYWLDGDADGVITLEFDGALLDDENDRPTAALTYGNTEGEIGDCYYETMTCDVSGTKVIADFTGKLRRNQDMITTGNQYNTILLKIGNLKDEGGNYVFTEGQGTLGSFSWQLAYEEVEANIAARFIPASGSMLDDVDCIMIGISGADKVLFDAITLVMTFADKEGMAITTEYDDLSIEWDGTFATITVDIPQEFKNERGEVMLFFDGLVCADGLDYS